jgi:hypothetical protein
MGLVVNLTELLSSFEVKLSNDTSSPKLIKSAMCEIH